jgi:hypothetical protein
MLFYMKIYWSFKICSFLGVFFHMGLPRLDFKSYTIPVWSEKYIRVFIFQGGIFRFVLVLPDKGNTLTQLEADMVTRDIASLQKRGRVSEYQYIYIPKIDLDVSVQLNMPLDQVSEIFNTTNKVVINLVRSICSIFQSRNNLKQKLNLPLFYLKMMYFVRIT